MSAPDPFAALLTAAWPLPEPMPLTEAEREKLADEAWRDACAATPEEPEEL